MAIYVGIKRLNANDEFAEYSFGPNEEEVGRLRINKHSGEIEVLEEVAGDDSKKYSVCAAREVLHGSNDAVLASHAATLGICIQPTIGRACRFIILPRCRGQNNSRQAYNVFGLGHRIANSDANHSADVGSSRKTRAARSLA